MNLFECLDPKCRIQNVPARLFPTASLDITTGIIVEDRTHVMQINASQRCTWCSLLLCVSLLPLCLNLNLPSYRSFWWSTISMHFSLCAIFSMSSLFADSVWLDLQSGSVQCCLFTSTEAAGLLGTGAQDGHLDFHTLSPEFGFSVRLFSTVLFYVHRKPYGLLGMGSPGRPSRLSHSSWAVIFSPARVSTCRSMVRVEW